MTERDPNADGFDVSEYIESLDRLWRLQGAMLARCPVTEQLSTCGVYHDRAGTVVYVSEAGIESLDVVVTERNKSLPAYLDAQDITHHFERPEP